MLKLKLQYFATWCEELTHWKRPWCWERLKAGEGDNRGWDGSMTSPTQWTWVWVNSELVMDREANREAVHGAVNSETQLSEWTELNWTEVLWDFVCLLIFSGHINYYSYFFMCFNYHETNVFPILHSNLKSKRLCLGLLIAVSCFNSSC